MLKPIIAIVTCLVVIFLVWLKPEARLNQANISSVHSSAQVSAEQASIEQQASRNNQLPEFLSTSSLRGTSIDGLYPVDDAGNLILSGSIKHRFEYFLSTMGEFSLEDVQKMIRDDIKSNLQEPARSQALQLFEDYVGYKYALTDLEASLDAPQDYEINDIEHMRSQLQQLRDKRREYFNQEAVDAFFGFDELYDDFMLNRLEIQASSQLSEAEKAEQISSLEQNLPEHVRSMRDETQRISQVFEITQDMRDEGASEDAIFERNSQAFGQAAAERLQVLDNKRQVFQQKADSYLAQKQTILENESMSNTEKKEQLDELLSEFDTDERRKLNALEIMNQEHSETTSN
ncbi:lipase secretion chaperone [Pseudomonas sp. HK3]